MLTVMQLEDRLTPTTAYMTAPGVLRIDITPDAPAVVVTQQPTPGGVVVTSPYVNDCLTLYGQFHDVKRVEVHGGAEDDSVTVLARDRSFARGFVFDLGGGHDTVTWGVA